VGIGVEHDECVTSGNVANPFFARVRAVAVVVVVVVLSGSLTHPAQNSCVRAVVAAVLTGSRRWAGYDG
jgi:hypothetical protein